MTHPPRQLEKVGAVGLERPVVFEMRVNADGTFQAVVTEKIIQITVLPPADVHRRAEATSEPRRHEVTSLAEVEAAIGVSLPAEVHELYASG